MQEPLLEVIALDVDDARAAEDGGADRVELCRDLDVGGLSPEPATVERVRAAVGLPVPSASLGQPRAAACSPAMNPTIVSRKRR